MSSSDSSDVYECECGMTVSNDLIEHHTYYNFEHYQRMKKIPSHHYIQEENTENEYKISPNKGDRVNVSGIRYYACGCGVYISLLCKSKYEGKTILLHKKSKRHKKAIKTGITLPSGLVLCSSCGGEYTKTVGLDKHRQYSGCDK